jgi:hypothetical protein
MLLGNFRFSAEFKAKSQVAGVSFGALSFCLCSSFLSFFYDPTSLINLARLKLQSFFWTHTELSMSNKWIPLLLVMSCKIELPRPQLPEV